VMWLLGRLGPDHKTIADFRKDSGPAIRKVCAQFVALCRELGLLATMSIAIDGSKFKAVNNRDKTIDLIRSSKLRSLAVTTAKRMNMLPDVPTIGEFIPGYEAAGWVGLGAPANTAPEIIAILNRQVNAALADPTFKARLVDLGEEPFANTSAQFGNFITEYTETWAKVIRAANIKPE
jgi:tripartite-type tricarboxylate transporter receptor subunit TctC